MSISKREVYSANPFRIEHKHIARIPNVQDGVTVGHRTADFQKHIRIFQEFHDDMELLSSMAIKILVYIFSELRDNEDEVYFDIDTFLRYTNRKKIGEVGHKEIKNKAGVYRGIDDLIVRDIIARKAGDVKRFYINPAKFFPGSRNKWYEESKNIPEKMRSILVDRRINGQKNGF